MLSTFSRQTVEQLEVIQELVFPEVSKVNDLVINKKYEDQYSFLQKKNLEKKVDSSLLLFLLSNIPPIDGSNFKIIESSDLNKFFHVSKC